jgi:hypothetical protein
LTAAGLTRFRTIRRFAAGVTLAVAAACGGGSGPVTAPVVTPVKPSDTTTSYPGFDIGVYPGTPALQAWKYPASPFRWVGYYLPAPCHRDTTWAAKYTTASGMGWGVVPIYVGQQDWANIPADRAPLGAQPNRSVESQVTCSASLLSPGQGSAEAADAVGRLRADGFPDGSTVFLDIEHVTTVSQPLLDYYRAWVAGVLSDGHFMPGVYASKSNAPTFHALSFTDSHGASYTPPFWIAASGGMTLTSRPSDVGLAFAQIWQGMFDIAQQFNGVTLRVDVDVAAKASPGAP